MLLNASPPADVRGPVWLGETLKLPLSHSLTGNRAVGAPPVDGKYKVTATGQKQY
jgi:hypothetical protein